MSFIYPWQSAQWQQVWQATVEQRLPHALLLSGMAGLGKAHFADCFSRALLCQSVTPDGVYCNVCHMCQLVEGRAHPNVLWVQPEKENSAIKVDQIRAVNEFIQQTSMQGHHRIVIIHPANNMNVNAANALLKTLEEPPPGALLILTSDQSSRLPATIRSRCQQISFSRPDTQEALAWLAEQKIEKEHAETVLNLANGAPLSALRFVNDEILSLRQSLFELLYALSLKQADPIKSAASFQSEESLPLLDFMISWVMDLSRLQVGGDTIINKDYESQLLELSQRTHLRQTTKLMDNVLALRQQVSGGFNLNKQLLLEAVFFRWMECATCF